MERQCFGAAVAMAVFCGTVWACFAYIPLDRMVEESPVIVTDEFVRVGKGWYPWWRYRGWDIATIRIERVLKNDTGDASLKPGGTLRLAVLDREPQISLQCRRHTRGTSGVWHLSPGRHVLAMASRQQHERLRASFADGKMRPYGPRRGGAGRAAPLRRARAMAGGLGCRERRPR